MGVEIHHDCAVCCQTDECVTSHIASVQAAHMALTPAHMPLGCPHHCSENLFTLIDCIVTAHGCYHENLITCILSVPAYHPDEKCHDDSPQRQCMYYWRYQ